MVGRWTGAAVIAATLLALALQTGVVTRTGFFMGDFRAFYCAARVAVHGVDPYRTEPLRSCETAIGRTPFFEKNPGVVIPAPLPGYALAALVPLAMLPFAAAATFWLALLLLAWYACIAALARFAGVGWQIALAVLGLSLGVLSLPFGEVVPIAVACICLSACLAWQGRYRAAAIAAACAMIEPHLGLPACIALAFRQPAARLPLAIAFGTFGLMALLLLGPATNVEYFTSVLPAHALSEASRDTQYSLTAILTGIGIGPEVAVRAGSLWYVAMVVIGIAIGGALAKQLKNEAFAVCVAPAFAVFGGTFIHVTQIAVALPAAVLYVGVANGRARPLALIALLLLVVPWDWVISPALTIAPLIPVAYLAWRYSGGNVRVILLAGVGAAALSLGLTQLIAAAPHAPTYAAPSIDPRFAEAAWSRFTQQGSTNALAAWMLRLPTWTGLALLLALLVRQTGVLRRAAPAAPTFALGALCTLLPIGAQFYADSTTARLGIDARAYYCAARAQRLHANPYFAQPLGTCEQKTPSPYYRPPRNVTVPAPYPPYALALFAPLTLLPFATAAALWWTLLALALLVTAFALARVSGVPWLAAWAAIALSAGLAAFSAGNVMPFALCALVVAALAVARNRPLLAGTALTAAMIEPHIGLPAAVAVFAGYPAVRLPLAVGLGVLGWLSFATAGAASTLSYLTTVVPAHALAEVSRDNQYSLSSVLAAVGLPDASAVFIGSLSYAVMLALGVIVALRLAPRIGEPAMIVLVPPAFSLLGGSFVHTLEIAAAVPACLVLFKHAAIHRAWIFAALLLLAVPWMMATSAALFLAPLFPVAYLTYTLWRNDSRNAVVAAAISAAMIFGLFALAAAPSPHAIAAHTYPPIDPRLAEASWRQFVLGNSTNRLTMWLLRLPTWIGLVAFVVPAIALARKPRLALAVQAS
jgi:hypothetical protein